MAKLSDDRIQQVFHPMLKPGEELQHWAVGIKQPNMLLIVGLMCLAILPGVIAVHLLSRFYLVGLTNRRFIVLRIKGINNASIKEVTEYSRDELKQVQKKTSTGMIFNHIRIYDRGRPFVAKFHRAYSRDNRAHATAICEAISA